MIFKRAIVKLPPKTFPTGLVAPDSDPADYNLAVKQHANYIKALQACGLEVIPMKPDDAFPDSTFVEDAALITPHCAVITNPGATTRKGEIITMQKVLGKYFEQIEAIHDPGTLEAGDIMMVGHHYYIGLSERTNPEGAAQLITILNNYGMTGSTVPLKKVLHLKSGVSYLENNNMVVAGEFIENEVFNKFNLIRIPDEETYAANCIWVNGTVLLPKGYPATTRLIQAAGYPTIELEVSEFRKMNGGLSCLSLRF